MIASVNQIKSGDLLTLTPNVNRFWTNPPDNKIGTPKSFEKSELLSILYLGNKRENSNKLYIECLFILTGSRTVKAWINVWMFVECALEI